MRPSLPSCARDPSGATGCGSSSRSCVGLDRAPPPNIMALLRSTKLVPICSIRCSERDCDECVDAILPWSDRRLCRADFRFDRRPQAPVEPHLVRSARARQLVRQWPRRLLLRRARPAHTRAFERSAVSSAPTRSEDPRETAMRKLLFALAAAMPYRRPGNRRAQGRATRRRISPRRARSAARSSSFTSPTSSRTVRSSSISSPRRSPAAAPPKRTRSARRSVISRKPARR